jgi:hypothetical protein
MLYVHIQVLCLEVKPSALEPLTSGFSRNPENVVVERREKYIKGMKQINIFSIYVQDLGLKAIPLTSVSRDSGISQNPENVVIIKGREKCLKGTSF